MRLAIKYGFLQAALDARSPATDTDGFPKACDHKIYLTIVLIVLTIVLTVLTIVLARDARRLDV